VYPRPNLISQSGQRWSAPCCHWSRGQRSIRSLIFICVTGPALFIELFYTTTLKTHTADTPLIRYLLLLKYIELLDALRMSLHISIEIYEPDLLNLLHSLMSGIKQNLPEISNESKKFHVTINVLPTPPFFMQLLLILAISSVTLHSWHPLTSG